MATTNRTIDALTAAERFAHTQRSAADMAVTVMGAARGDAAAANMRSVHLLEARTPRVALKGASCPVAVYQDGQWYLLAPGDSWRSLAAEEIAARYPTTRGTKQSTVGQTEWFGAE